MEAVGTVSDVVGVAGEEGLRRGLEVGVGGGGVWRVQMRGVGVVVGWVGVMWAKIRVGMVMMHDSDRRMVHNFSKVNPL